MIEIRKSEERGRTRLDWLDSRHTFSFADYYDPAEMGFSCLRVINEDRIAPGRGFDTHRHRDMEIVTWVLAGALRHHDSMGNGSVIRPGELQRMTAGTGISHSEYNDSAVEPVHLLQIWIEPSRRALQPSYEQRAFPADSRRDQLQLLVSPDGRDGSVRINQDVLLYSASLRAGVELASELASGRRAWVQVTSGSLQLNGLRLDAGVGARIVGEDQVLLAASAEAGMLFFDLP